LLVQRFAGELRLLCAHPLIPSGHFATHAPGVPQIFATAAGSIFEVFSGELVDSLKEDGDKIIAALDELLTR
jgi:hypothetical protein